MSKAEADMARAGDGKPRSNRRRATRQLSKRLTTPQFDAFIARARGAGFEDAQGYLTAFILAKVDLDTTTRRETIRVLGELGKIGSNINQIAKAANQGRIQHMDARAASTLEAMHKQIEMLGRELREALR